MPDKIKRCPGSGPVKLQRCPTSPQKLSQCTQTGPCPSVQDTDFPFTLRFQWTGPVACTEENSEYSYDAALGQNCCFPQNPVPSWNSRLTRRFFNITNVIPIDLTLTWNGASHSWNGLLNNAWNEVNSLINTTSNFNCFTGQTNSNTVPSISTLPVGFGVSVSCDSITGLMQVNGTGGLVVSQAAPSPGRTGTPARWWRNPFTLQASTLVLHPCTNDTQGQILTGCQCNSLCEQSVYGDCRHTNGSYCAGPCEYTENGSYQCPEGTVGPFVARRYIRSGNVPSGQYVGGGTVTIQRTP